MSNAGCYIQHNLRCALQARDSTVDGIWHCLSKGTLERIARKTHKKEPTIISARAIPSIKLDKTFREAVNSVSNYNRVRTLKVNDVTVKNGQMTERFNYYRKGIGYPHKFVYAMVFKDTYLTHYISLLVH